MKPLDIDSILRLVTLRDDGRWLFSQAASERLRGLPVPSAASPEGAVVYFFHGTHYAVGSHYDPLLKAYAALPPEARQGIGSLDPGMVSEAHSTINIVDKMSPLDTWTAFRDRAMQDAVRRLMKRTGAEQFQVIPAVASLFDVAHRVVKKAMGGLIHEGGAEPDHKKDHRWRSVVGEAHRAKSSAYGRDTVRAAGTAPRYGRFSAEDLLIKHRGELLFPERCPVLGLPLIYDRHSYPKDLRLISIARRDPTKPMGPDNVHLVSRRAYKLLETRSKPETQEEADAVQRWRYGTNTSALTADANQDE